MNPSAILVYLVFCAFIGFLADKRGRRPFVWVGVAVVASPLIALIVLLILPDLAADRWRAGR